MLKNNNVCIVIGGQWGDEGKGKIVDYISKDFDIVVRTGGGANAGHTIYANGKKIVLHLVPAGILQGKKCVIGNGCVVDLFALLDEIHDLDKVGIKGANLLYISDRAHVVFSFYKDIDELLEKDSNIGTTRRGIGPAYMFKVMRKGIRIGDIAYDFENFVLNFRILCEYVKNIYGLEVDVDSEIIKYRDIVDAIEGMVIDTGAYINKSVKEGKNVLFEGAQGSLLDIDQGTYPFVTSSITVSSGALVGSGVRFPKNNEIIAIAKAYMTRVGNGPFPTELNDKTGDILREKGSEYGATTGRPRRCGWLDLVLLKKVCEESGVTMINITKLDVLTGFSKIRVANKYILDGEEIYSVPITKNQIDKLEVEYKDFDGWEDDISKIRHFKDLPVNAKNYINYIEEYTGVKINFIGVGVDREDFIIR